MYLDNIRKPVVVIALGLVVTGCAHLANVKTTQPGAPRLMVGEQQLRSATEHLARARHEQSSLSLGNNLSAAKLSLDVLERRPRDVSAQRIYNFSVARVVEDVERALIFNHGENRVTLLAGKRDFASLLLAPSMRNTIRVGMICFRSTP